MINKILTLLLVINIFSFAKNKTSDREIKKVLLSMETKNKPNYLSKYEWEVLLYINYVRLFPKEFAKKELIPFIKKKYTDKNSSNYKDYVKPAIDRLLGKYNRNNRKVNNINKKIKLLGKVKALEPSLAYTLAERDFLSDPKRNGHRGSLGGWTKYVTTYLEKTDYNKKYFRGQDVYLSTSGEIAWPILPDKYTSKEAVIEWIIDRGNKSNGYGHRELILKKFDGKCKVGIAIQKAPNNIENKQYKGMVALHIGFGVNYFQQKGFPSGIISKEKKNITSGSKNKKLKFRVFRKPFK